MLHSIAFSYLSRQFLFRPQHSALMQGGGALRAVISANSSKLVRDRISQFAGHAPALSIRSEEGKTVVATAEVVDLSPMQPVDSLFTPSPDLKRVTDMHTLKVTTAR